MTSETVSRQSRNGIEIKHYNEETENFYRTDISNDYMGGTTRMTKTEMDLKQASSKAFSFMVHHNKMNPDRLIQIYDVADDLVVEGDALRVDGAVAVGDDPGPGHGEAVGLEAQLLHQVDVLLPVMVEVGGDLGVSLLVGALEGVEVGHGHALAALVPAALDLESGGSRAPPEVLGELVSHVVAPFC